MAVDWLYNPPICTGIGDRLGTILALSALASLHNSSYVVHLEWCTQPERAVMSNPQFMRWIPGWTGYDFPIETLHATLTLPSNIRLYTSGRAPSRFDGLVLEEGTVPAWGAISQTSTLFCRALSMGERTSDWTTHECETAYKKAGGQVQPVATPEEDLPYILVHFRSGDANTEARDERPFCTRAVLRELHTAGLYMKVISNNHSFSMHWLQGLPSMHLVHSTSVFQDVLLALSATAIVQHASTGWSSYTSVPAMARGIPLINTFTGDGHRFDMFASYGKVPDEFYSCHGLREFVLDVVERSRRT
jgi:hypothetical protein